MFEDLVWFGASVAVGTGIGYAFKWLVNWVWPEGGKKHEEG